MEILGTVLWWDSRDGNGIIKDDKDNRYYFDTSVLQSLPKTFKPGTKVTFQKNSAIKDCLCACNVYAILTRKKTGAIQKESRPTKTRLRSSVGG